MSGDSGGEEARLIQMTCLGRPFTLGMLYDSRRDILVPGETLWSNSTLKSALNSEKQAGSGFQIIAEDSLESKATNLDIDARLKLSFLGGMVEVGGSAKYLDNRLTSEHQARVSLKYWSTSRFDQLTMEQLGNPEYPNVLSKQTATHVVVGALYGADGIFVFDRKVTKIEDKRKVKGQMEVLIKCLPGITEIDGSASVNFSHSDKKETDKFECTFHGDLHLPRNPTTFDSAVKIYQQLPELLNDSTVVPKKVWLYPLSKLNSKAAQLVHEISIGLVHQAQEVMGQLLQLEIKVNDLLSNDVCSCFSSIQQQLLNFKGRIAEYRMSFSKKLNQILPKICEGGVEESQLADVFKTKEASPFSNAELSGWIKSKQQEI